MIRLHDFQADIVAALRAGYAQGHTRQMCALATGGGKTVLAAHLIRSGSEKGRKSIFIVDRIELVRQAVDTFQAIGLRVGVMQSDNTWVHMDDEVVVGTRQTFAARGVPPAGFAMIDEAHVLAEDHIKLMQRWDRVAFIGLSATPLRPDLGKYFTNLVRGPSVAWLTENGFLTPARAFCPDEASILAATESVKQVRGEYAKGELAKAMNVKSLIGDVVATWQALGENRQTIGFAVDIPHSKALQAEFDDAGIPAGHIDAYTPPEARKRTIEAFKAGDLQVLFSVNVLGIGFDYPGASCAILARPTLSEALHMQQVGRVIRRYEGKQDAVILDHSGNTVKFGLPVDFVVPDLGTGEHPKGKKKPSAKRMAVCPHCKAVIEKSALSCPECGRDLPVRSSGVLYRDGNLIEYGTKAGGAVTYTVSEQRGWYLALRWYAEHRGWKDGWAYFAYLQKFGTKPPYAWRDLKAVEPTGEQSRWIRHYQIAAAKRRAA